MCGIYGVIGSPEAAKEIYLGLAHLQHRGQDAAGLLTYDSNHKDNESGIYGKNDLGLVGAIFDDKALAKLKGSLGIGFTRYPTAGTGDVSEVQPIFLRHPDGVGLAFNGNIVNYPSLRQKLKENSRRVIYSNCDAEVILHEFAEEFSKGKEVNDIFKAVEEVFTSVIGAYSVVCMIAGKGLLVFRDPKGIRPLVMGVRRNGTNSYAFASESVALSVLGYESIEDVEPGEAIFIDMNLNVHRKTIIQRQPAHCSFEWVYFSTAESVIEGKSVYEVRSRLGIALAKKIRKLMPDLDADVIIPVPDTSRTAANALARELGIPYEEGLIKNRYIFRTFIMPMQKKREDSVRLKMKPVEHVIRGKNVIVVDDSIVRGTTSNRIAKLPKDSGAKKVYFVSTFPPIRYPCVYGIDFQDPKELIAADRTIPEIEAQLSVDRLIYLDEESLAEAIGRNDICMACVTGEYPTSIKDSEELRQLRLSHIKVAGEKPK
ncbi:MAG: amidophosphoribosyltransferase [Nanoarchaeota archaeon]